MATVRTVVVGTRVPHPAGFFLEVEQVHDTTVCVVSWFHFTSRGQPRRWTMALHDVLTILDTDLLRGARTHGEDV